MKTILTALLLLAAAPLRATDPGCAQTADACSAKSGPVSPFTAASLREALPPAASAAGKTRAALRQAEAKTAKAAAPEPAPAAAPVEAPETPAAPAIPAQAAAGLSNPLWLLFIGAGISGLYFYLAGPARKGRRK